MTLSENIGKWYKMYSTQALATIVALQTALLAFPPSIAERPIFFLGGYSVQDIGAAITVFLAIAGFIGRFIKQPSVTTE